MKKIEDYIGKKFKPKEMLGDSKYKIEGIDENGVKVSWGSEDYMSKDYEYTYWPKEASLKFIEDGTWIIKE